MIDYGEISLMAEIPFDSGTWRKNVPELDHPAQLANPVIFSFIIAMIMFS